MGGIAVFWKKSLRARVWNPQVDDEENQWIKNERVWILLENENMVNTALCGIYAGVNDAKNEKWNEVIYQSLESEIR